MADVDNQSDDATTAKADAMALAEQAEAEAAAAEALAAAARARARALRLRREAEARAESARVTSATTAPVETTDIAPEAPEAAEPPAAPIGSSRQRRWRAHPRIARGLAVVAVVVICGLLATSGYMIWYNHAAVEQRQSSAAFAAAARQGVINMLSLDFNKAKEDVQRVIDSSTGEFRDDFQKRAGDFTTVVEQSKAVTEGTVTATAVESMSKDSAVVLVLATERVTNAAGAKDEPRAFRLRVAVARDGDQIKLSKVEFVL
jgi:Mce-associated membrane protein